MKARVVVVCIFLSFCSYQSCYSVDIGSDTSVARFVVTQSLDNSDRIAGFASVENGFELKGAFVTGTFDSLFPITGRLDLNGGTLVLAQNLQLGHTSEWEMLGNITGQNRLLDVGGSITTISSLSDDIFQGRLYAVAKTGHSNTIKSVDWSWDSQYIAVASDVVSTSSALAIYQFDGTTITLLQTSTLVGALSDANEVRWHPYQYILALVRNNNASGEEVLTYSFVPGTNQLIKVSSDEIGDDVTAASWHPSGNYLATGGFSNTTELVIYPVTANGSLDIAGKLSVNIAPNQNVREEALDWNSTGDYLAVGFNNAPELCVYKFNTSPLSLALNASHTVGNLLNGLDWSPTFSWIFAVGITGAVDDLALYAHNNVAGSLTQIASDSLGGGVKSSSWDPTGTILAVGKAAIASVSKFNTYKFDASASNLTLCTNREFSSTVEAVRWSPDGLYVAEGNGTQLGVYGLIRNHSSLFDDVNIALHGDVTLKNCSLIFLGDCSIDGGGHVLNLEPSALIKIRNNTTLHLKNITVNGLKKVTFTMLNGGSRLLLENATIKIGQQLFIDKGCIDVLGSVFFTGNDSLFIYSTDQASTIGSKSELVFDADITFSYDAPAPNLLQFADNSGKIVLMGATLHATSTGLVLKDGKMDVVENSFLSSEIIQTSAGTIDNGITFGTGVKAENFKVRIFPNVSLDCISGSVRYKNIGSAEIQMENNQSHMHFHTGTTLWLYNTLDIKPGFIAFDAQSRIMRAAGKDIVGSIIPGGPLIRGRFTP